MTKDNLEARDFSLEPVDRNRLANLVGPEDENLKQISNRLGVEIGYSGARFLVEGSSKNSKIAERIIKQLYIETAPLGKKGKAQYITPDKVNLVIIENSHLEADSDEHPLDFLTPQESLEQANNARAVLQKKQHAELKDKNKKKDDTQAQRGEIDELYHKASTLKTQRGVIKARTPNQADYISQIVCHDVNFGIGPAGTGKTFLAVAAAVDALTRNEVRRIILTRPAVEAGEKLGFLPGDLSQKVDPYLRPLYDALFEMLGFEKVEKLIERQVIEIAPLAYMRGRTLNDSFIILDEAQNTTVEQMKMFLTRIGFNSKAVITGDPSQVDLPRNVRSGLRHAIDVLSHVSEISFTYFQSDDVVRHPVVAAIVNAYDAYDRAHKDEDNDFNRRSNRQQTPRLSESNERNSNKEFNDISSLFVKNIADNEQSLAHEADVTRRLSEANLQANDILNNILPHDIEHEPLEHEYKLSDQESSKEWEGTLSPHQVILEKLESHTNPSIYKSTLEQDVAQLERQLQSVERAFDTADDFDMLMEDLIAKNSVSEHTPSADEQDKS